MPEGTDGAQAKRVVDAFDKLSSGLKASRADALVVIGTDHMMTFSYDAVPVFAIGAGAGFPSWGEAGSPKTTYRGLERLGDEVIGGMIDSGFDVVSVAEMRVDHAFACPLSFVLRDADIPILPIYVNCTVPPLPSLGRCLAFGRQLSNVLQRQSAVERVAVLGTGGLSHWVGLPQTGQINSAFDRKFLDHFEAGHLDQVSTWPSDDIITDAGNGAAEIRNWLVAAGAAGMGTARRLAYEPVSAWKTGIGLVELGDT